MQRNMTGGKGFKRQNRMIYRPESPVCDKTHQQMTRILVTGSNGQLGNELRLVLPQDMAGVPLLFADKNELDLTDAAASDKIV